MTYSEMKNNRKALERENTSVKFEKPMTYSEMKPINNILNGKDTLFNDIMSFGKSAMGDNAYSNYYKGGFKTPDDYTAASNYILSSIDTVKGYKDRLNKNRAAYERVYGADVIKEQEKNLDELLSLYNGQELWDSIEGRRDAFAQYKDADEYDTLNDMTAGREKILDDKISAAQEDYNNALSKARKLKYISRVKLPDSENQDIDIELAKDKERSAKSELERLKQLKLDWEKARVQYDDEGTPFSEKYNGYDYKGIGLAINALASKEYALSDSQKRELKWLRDNQISYANDEELENALALAKGQAENAEKRSLTMNRISDEKTANPLLSDDTFDPYTVNQKEEAGTQAEKYQAKAPTLENYYNERKENERIAAIEQQVYEKYMPLLDDEEFAKHTGFERDKYVAYDPTHSPSPQSGYADSVYASQTRDGFDEGENQFTPDEFKVFNGLWNTQGEEAAQEFLDELRPVLDKRITDAENARLRKNTREHPYIGSFAAVLNNLVSGLALVDDVFAKINGKEINPYSSAHGFGNAAQAIRGTTSQMLSDYLRKNPDSFWNNKSVLFGRDEDGNYRALGLFAKETTESMLDNLARIAMSKGVGMAAGGSAGLSEAALKTIDFTLMGSQVATQTIIDAKKRGLSDGKALAMGFTSGAIEAITEVWSIEKVLGNPKSFIKTLGKSLVAEGSEEIASNIFNRAVDVLINADQSEVMQEYYGYINEGLSPSEASAKTLTGIIGDDLSAGLGGALSGVMMSGTNYRLSQAVEQSRNIKNGIRQIKVGRELKSTDSVITALDEIIAANPDNKEAVTAKAAIEKGEKVSARRLGKLLTDEFSTQYEKAVTNVDSAEVKAKLEQNGVKNAETLSKTIAKAFNEGLDSVKGKERTELTHNSEAMKVYREYFTERENAAENAGRLTRVYTNVDRAELLSYAKEQGKNNSFIREASDLAEGKTDLDSLDNLQEAVFTEITDQFLSADTVEEAQNVYKELSKGAGKGIKSLLDTALDNRTEEITAENSYDTVESVSFNNTKDGVKAVVSTAKGKDLSPLSANIGYEAAAVINNAADRPTAVRNLYANEYIESNRHLVASTYNRLFDKYYEAGEKGQSFSDIKRTSRDLKPSSARKIYEAGRAQAKSERNRQEQYKQSTEYKNRSKERTEQNAAAKKQGGVVREYSASKKVSRQQRQQLRLLDVWAKEKGVVIRVVDSLADKIKLDGKVINGRYEGGNVITIALDGRNMLTSTAGHELYHMIQRLSPEYAKSFSEFVINHLKEAGKYDSVFKDYERRYGKTYARDENFKAKIDEEIVADHCFEALTNKEQWESFAAENKTIADKIKDFIKEFVAMINRAFDKYFVHDNAEIRNEVIGEVDYMNEIARRLSEGVDEAVENYRFGAGTEGETKYQLVGETSDGIEVYETSGKTKALTEKERKKQYLSLMRNKYAGRTARFVRNGHTYYAEFDRSNYNKPIYGEFHNSAQGKKALIRLGADGDVFELVENAEYSASRADSKNHKVKDGFTDYFDYFVKTVQIDGRFYDLTATVKKKYGEKNGYTYSLFLRNNKTRTAPTMEQQNVSFKVSAQPLSDTKISQNDTDVNTHSMQKSKNNSSFSISDEEYMSAAESGDEKTAAKMVRRAAEEAFKDSVVRDDNGHLITVYHGRVSKFNVFDREFASIEGDMGKGFYFSSQENDVDSNYANVEGPDLTNKIARLAERIEAEQDIDYDEAEKKAREQYIKSEPNTVEAYLNVKNPAIISNDNDGTYLEYNENYDEETDDYGDPEGSLVDFVEALESAAEDYESFRPVNFWEALGDSIYGGGISLKDAIPLLKENIIDELLDENGELAINEVIRQAIEDIGFDGIIDKTVSEKFPNMQGMYSDTTHYIVFDSSQIKSADPITYDDSGNIIPLSERFNSSEKDIRYSISENAEKDVQALLDGKKFTGDIKLTDSSPRIILGHKGVRNLPMLMKPSHILENILTTEEAEKRGLEIDPEKIHYHGLGKTLFLDIIRGLDNVNQAYRGTKNAEKSERRQNYFLLISTLKDAEGNVINVPVYINEKGRYNRVSIDTNKIGTAFGREQLQGYIQKEIKNGNLVRIKKRSSLDSGLTGDKVPDRHNEATSRGGSEVSEKPTTKADDYYSIASDNSILQSNEKSQEKNVDIQDNILSDDQRASISDAGMRLTDNTELSSLMRENADYKAEIERLKGEFIKSKRMGGKGKLYNMTFDGNVILNGYGKSNVLNYVLNSKKEGRILYASEKIIGLIKTDPGSNSPTMHLLPITLTVYHNTEKLSINIMHKMTKNICLIQINIKVLSFQTTLQSRSLPSPLPT